MYRLNHVKIHYVSKADHHIMSHEHTDSTERITVSALFTGGGENNVYPAFNSDCLELPLKLVALMLHKLQ